MPPPQTYFSIDRNQFLVVAISQVTGNVYLLEAIEDFETNKSDNGDAGTWRFSCPLVQVYPFTDQVVYDQSIAYASIAKPMDLIAIYASRNITTQTTDLAPSQSTQGPALGPVNGVYNIDALTYGSANASVTAQLGSASCVMIGMMDRYSKGFVMTEAGPEWRFSCSGRDLTKIFYVNDATVPETVQGVELQSNAVVLELNGANSGTTLLLQTLDAIVTKDLTTVQQQEGLTNQTVSIVKQFGYPWRNFIRTDNQTALPPNFKNFGSQAYPSFPIQQGSSWANLVELRNYPSARLYVDEIGQLTFNDQYNAWVQQDVLLSVPNTDVQAYEEMEDDSDVITFLTIFLQSALANQLPQTAVRAQTAPSFLNGLQQAASSGSSSITQFGYRFGQFNAFYDFDTTTLANTQRNLILLHNSMLRASVTVRGNPIYRVGNRIQLNVQTDNLRTTGANWYIEKVQHKGMFGDDYVTSMSLRFPCTGNIPIG